MTDRTELQAIIEASWEGRESLTPGDAKAAAAVEEVLQGLDSGLFRVAERNTEGQWLVNQWLKKAVLLSFRLTANSPAEGVGAPAYDKVPLKTAGWGANRFSEAGFRMVPGAVVRRVVSRLAGRGLGRVSGLTSVRAATSVTEPGSTFGAALVDL